MMRLSNLYTYDANDLGLMLLVAVPLALWLMGTVRRRGKVLISALLLSIGAALALSGSRGAFVGGAGLAIALLGFLRTVPFRKRLLVVGALGLGMAVMAPPGYWNQMSTMLEPKDDYNWSSESGRRQIWLRGLGYMADYPVFGIGAGNFPRAEGMISDIAMTQSADRGIKWLAAHNSFVQVGAEMGIVGLTLWSFLVFGGLVGMVRLRRRMPAGWARGDPEQRFLYESTMYMPAAYVAFVVPAFFLSFAYMDPVYFLSALYCGVHAAVDRRLRRDRMMRSGSGFAPELHHNGRAMRRTYVRNSRSA
ncbi:MAG: O-antigen ligase family protein, partial [Gemmatimonadetes bacterium]|nr:O-antigen ligase family protein [Gemmatimonadota bacterium]